MRAIIVAAACACFGAQPVSAQLGTPAPRAADTAVYSPSHMAAAKALLEAMDFEELAMSGVLVTLEAQMEENPDLEMFRDVLHAWAKSVFGSEEAKTAFARAYASELTQAEIEAVVTFYRTPAGRTIARAQPQLARHGARIGAELAAKRQGELESMIEARAAELESLPTAPGAD